MKTDFDRAVARDERRQAKEKGKPFTLILLLFIGLVVWASLGYFCILGLIDALDPNAIPDRPAAPAASTEDAGVIEFSNPHTAEENAANERWAACDRQIYFGTQYSYRAIDENTAPAQGKAATLFYRYFQAILAGDSEKYRACFDSASPALRSIPAEFNPQMLFDMYVLEYGVNRETTENGEELCFTDFIVRYRILENDGTFRHDLKSSAQSEEYYRLVTDKDGQARIYSILKLEARQKAATEAAEPASDTRTGRAILFGAGLLVLASVPVIGIILFVKRKHKNGENA